VSDSFNITLFYDVYKLRFVGLANALPEMKQKRGPLVEKPLLKTTEWRGKIDTKPMLF
jgi:hypothetical protein